jgi:hypothetical protein
MFEEMIGELEDMIIEIDSIIEIVENITPSFNNSFEPHFMEWYKNGSILNGGRSICIEGRVQNVYDVLASMAKYT